MPYKFETEKMKMKQEDKRNIKLNQEQKIKIKELYETGKYSQRQLAAIYNVSRKTIVFCIYPDKYIKSRNQFKERQKTGIYYNKEKQKEYAKNTRKYKKELYLKNKLIKEEE